MIRIGSSSARPTISMPVFSSSSPPLTFSRDFRHHNSATPPPGTMPSSTAARDRKSTRLNSSHSQISYAVFCLKKKTITSPIPRTSLRLFFFFFFNDTATTEIYTLSLHDALPIYDPDRLLERAADDLDARLLVLIAAPDFLEGLPAPQQRDAAARHDALLDRGTRSEEHTSELQSQSNLVCRLLLEKKNNNITNTSHLSSSFFFFFF